jgi:DNA-binding PadR family transcriptional regulator
MAHPSNLKYKNSLTMDILLLLFSGKRNVQKQMWRNIDGLEWRPLVSATQINKTLYRMKKQGWVEKKIIEDKVFYELTSRGELRYLIYNLRNHKRQKAAYSTIVIFDIPEEKRTYRDAIRRLLKQMDLRNSKKVPL